ncbi:hypothetical protein GCM10010309_41810 [Streptomyces violaceochromogenes]|nr:hypothetical protein GCM10010309_41810 [Streptomyces violaceochromogenes]
MDLLAVAEEPGVVLLGRLRVHGVCVAEECHVSPWSSRSGLRGRPEGIFAKRGAREKALVLPGPVL